MNAESAEWIRSQPKSIHALMRKFPPGCLVRATRPLVCPGLGEVGMVVSYLEEGGVTVVVNGNPIRGACQPDWLEVVLYQEGLTPEDVAAVLDAEAPAHD
jgi:hypothetical protein